jgi:predicted mannosyl-3-phosphoglycerate phosphatase (HAD superfamily)
MLLRGVGWTVVAAGDSPIDVEMLGCADRALFVPDQKGSPGLRALLPRVSGVRHLAVDARRFEGIEACSPEAVIQMIRRGGTWDAA